MLLVFTPFVFAPPTRALAQDSCSYTFQVEQVEASGKLIPVEIYRPTSPGPHPLVFMIHGSAGIFTLRNGQQPHPSNFGEDTFARNCYFVALPHYFALTGDRSIVDEPRLRALFPAFEDALKTIVVTESSRPETHAVPVFLYGESYGGFLAVALAGQIPNIRSVSVYGAGLPEPFEQTVPPLPPLLIQHGDQDAIVAPERATQLQQFWLHAHARVQLKLYPDAGHYFYFSETGRPKMLAETLAWFDEGRKSSK